MLFSGRNVRVFAYREATDMRCSFSGLSVLVESVLKEDPLSGHLFVFVNRRKDYVKLLYWDRGGYCLWSKRLEVGTYFLPDKGVAKLELSMTELMMLVDGIELGKHVKRKRYER